MPRPRTVAEGRKSRAKIGATPAGQRPQDRPKPLAPRWWAKVKPIMDSSSCWLWDQEVDPDHRYGHISAEGRRRPAHHAAWFLAYGRWPEYLLHTCDTPLCVRVDHLREGDHAANMRDMADKRRHWRHKQDRCYRGHEFDTVWADGVRRCSQCRKINEAARRGE